MLALLLLPAATGAPVKSPPATVEYFFGSAWPTCKAFGGQVFPKLQNDFADRAVFLATPAVGHPFVCSDETSCDWEKVTLCAFEAAGSQLGQPINSNASSFLECMDGADLPLFFEPKIPKGCASKTALQWEGIDTCFRGSRGDDLLSSAAARVTKQVGTGSFHIPLILVDGQKVCTSDDCDYDVVAKALGQPSPVARPRDAHVNLTYYFASKWPGCRAFGTDGFTKIAKDFAAYTLLRMVPAVRHPNTPQMHCIDEPTGDCTYERVTLCAFDAVGFDFQPSYDYLECMDFPWNEELTPAKAKKCADQVKISWSTISDCNKGSRGDDLLKQASEDYVATFPDPVYMPQASVNGVRVTTGDDTASYDAVKKAVCAAGASAPVC